MPTRFLLTRRKLNHQLICNLLRIKKGDQFRPTTSEGKTREITPREIEVIELIQTVLCRFPNQRKYLSDQEIWEQTSNGDPFIEYEEIQNIMDRFAINFTSAQSIPKS